jgi:hypothetical protein
MGILVGSGIWGTVELGFILQVGHNAELGSSSSSSAALSLLIYYAVLSKHIHM